MCFELDSSPPIPAISGAAVSHRELELEAADANRFAAFAAEPDDPTGACVVILPDVRGLYRFYEELALRLAERGHRAVAIDYFGRTAGVGKRDDARGDPGGRAGRGRVAGRRRVRRDRLAGLLLRRPPLVARRCGGPWAGLSDRVLRRPGERDGHPGPIQRAGEMHAPVLALQAGADANITAEANAEFERALEAAGVEHEVVVYEGAPHSFFDRKQEDFAEASEDAWNRVLDFIARQTTRVA